MLNHLLDVSIRSVVLALVAAIVLFAGRRTRTAAVQHAVWSAVVCGMLALFVFGEYLPRLPIRMPSRIATGIVSQTTSVPDAPLVVSANLSEPDSNYAVSTLSHPVTSQSRAINWGNVALDAYVVIASIFLLRFATGIFLAGRLIARSTRRGSFHESGLISIPVTVGYFPPRILLPPESRTWSNEKLDTVLAHEREHVRRRDGLVAALAHVNRCIFWFHPVAWMLERRLALLAEQACDDACVATLGDRNQYAQVLIEMANAAGNTRGRLRYHALTMAASSHIGQRIEALMVEGRSFSRGLGWSGGAAVMLCGIPIVLGAGSVAVESQLRPARMPIIQPTTIHAGSQGRKPEPPVILAQATVPPVSPKVTPVAFEAASIRPAVIPVVVGEGNGRSGGPSVTANCGPQRITIDPSLVHFRCVPVKGLIEFAFGIPQRPGLITGPDWMMDTSPGQRFDIEAKLPQGASMKQVPEMFQELLRDRFKLVVHRGTTEQQVTAIVVGKGGPKLKDASPNPVEPTPDPNAPPCVSERLCAPSVGNSHGEQIMLTRVAQQIEKRSSPSIGTALVTNSPQGTRIEAPSATMMGLAILLGPTNPLGVVDMTGLTGRYQIDVATSFDRDAVLRPILSAARAAQEANPNDPAANAAAAVANQTAQLELIAAQLQAWQVALQKVGLRLEQRKAAAATLIVDHVERMPTEN